MCLPVEILSLGAVGCSDGVLGVTGVGVTTVVGVLVVGVVGVGSGSVTTLVGSEREMRQSSPIADNRSISSTVKRDTKKMRWRSL